jgi:hypothetical protein
MVTRARPWEVRGATERQGTLSECDVTHLGDNAVVRLTVVAIECTVTCVSQSQPAR